jgi:hypothetical protein
MYEKNRRRKRNANTERDKRLKVRESKSVIKN